jgi:hypothetical protein
LLVTVTFAANPNPLEGLYMPRRPLSFVGAESPERIAAIQIARAQLFDVDVDRKKRIDDAIDYFGAGQIAVARKGVRQLRLVRIDRLTATLFARATRFRRACRIRPRAEKYLGFGSRTGRIRSGRT